MNTPLCYYGSPEPLPARHLLRAGSLTVVYEAGDLRYVRLGDREIVRRWYVAVRDRNWAAVPATLTNERLEVNDVSFRVTYDAAHRQGEMHFLWRGEISGSADGTIVFTMDGEAMTTFLRNRIGFCVLHPIRECAGAKCRIQTADGAGADTELPRFIAPRDNLFRELRSLAHEVSPGVWARLRFEGDLFETEDQRNWMDASYKTFCTPLRIPFPVEVPVGTRVRQRITLSLTKPAPAIPAALNQKPTLTIRAERTSAKLPAIGLGVASHGRPLSRREIDCLRNLGPKHLRVELDLTTGRWSARFKQAAAEATELGAGLELAVTASDAAGDEAAALLPILRDIPAPIHRILVYHQREWATPQRIIGPVSEAIARYDPAVPIYAGTTANFMELNCGRPTLAAIQGVCYSINPQGHAFDNASLIECCAAIADTVASARRLSGTLPLAVTPVTLRPRVNPYATGPAAAVPPAERPPQVDPRQMSLFGAAWTLGSLKFLAESGVASVAYYETTGWLGVMEEAGGCPLPEKFLSRPGMVFPLFHVLADANELAGADVLAALSSHPLTMDGLALRRDGRLHVLLANMTADLQAVAITGLPSRVRVRVLDESSFDRATSDPLAFRAESGEQRDIANGQLLIPVRPFGFVKIDPV